MAFEDEFTRVYHVVSAETNVIEPIAEGTAGYAIGVVCAPKA
jgi:hypothetical protein